MMNWLLCLKRRFGRTVTAVGVLANCQPDLASRESGKQSPAILKFTLVKDLADAAELRLGAITFSL